MAITTDGYTRSMSVEVPSRELRNHTAELLRRVEAGEEIVITVRGKPVAALTPLPGRRRRWMPKDELIRMLEENSADRGLLDELRRIPGGSTADDGLDEL